MCAKFIDLTGKTFGYLNVIQQAPDKVTPSGQKRKMWLCKCQLCGNEKVISSQDLKSGKTISCGCYRAYSGKQNRNKKVCIICGKEFESPPSDKTVTCSEACRKEYARKRNTGRTVSDETKKKISEKAQHRDMSGIQEKGTKAAQESPFSGRFKTNINAIDWHLKSPDGNEYYFHSLNSWLRENCKDLFGCEPDSREFNNVRSGLSSAKRAAAGKGAYGCCTYKGWVVYQTYDDDTGWFKQRSKNKALAVLSDQRKQIYKLYQSGVKQSEIARKFNVSRQFISSEIKMINDLLANAPLVEPSSLLPLNSDFPGLPTLKKQALILKHNGMTYEEIAENMGISRSRAIYLVYSARKILKSPAHPDADPPKLSPRKKQALELRESGMTYEEIAENMGITIGGALSLVSTAKKFLKENQIDKNQ